MAYEIDFLAVGDKGQSGDAIALRLGDLSDKDQQVVVVIDGGFQSSGEELVKLIQNVYGTSVVDLAISTHPDGDHSSGLKVVLDKLTVRQLWMHQPWRHTQEMADLFKSGRVTDRSVSEMLRRSLDDAYDLESLAKTKNTPVVEPFAGHAVEAGSLTFRVLGPSKEFYESLLPHFRCTPEPATQMGAFQKVFAGVEELVKRVAESWGMETLTDEGETSAENNTSVILLITHEDSHLLFTGDAGIPALTYAADELDRLGIDRGRLVFVQVPHHGSHRNVGPTVLSRILGPRRETDEPVRTAFVSAAKDGAPKHPAKRVLNAFRRRGSPVHGTDDGNPRFHHQGSQLRAGMTPSTPHPLYNEVEE